MTTAWIVLAHGSRELQARAAFAALVARLAAAVPGVRVEPAFFSLGEPDLPAQAARLAADGVRQVHILPLFLLDGVHVRRDIPALVADLQQRWPEVCFRLEPSLQDDPALVRLLAARITAPAQA